MKLSELAKKTDLKSVNKFTDKDFEGVYISDMVSDIITIAKPNSLLITLQTHKSLIATGNLVDLAAIVYVKGKMPATDVIQLADKPALPFLSQTSMPGPWRPNSSRSVCDKPVQGMINGSQPLLAL